MRIALVSALALVALVAVPGGAATGRGVRQHPDAADRERPVHGARRLGLRASSLVRVHVTGNGIDRRASIRANLRGELRHALPGSRSLRGEAGDGPDDRRRTGARAAAVVHPGVPAAAAARAGRRPGLAARAAPRAPRRRMPRTTSPQEPEGRAHRDPSRRREGGGTFLNAERSSRSGTGTRSRTRPGPAPTGAPRTAGRGRAAARAREARPTSSRPSCARPLATASRQDRLPTGVRPGDGMDRPRCQGDRRRADRRAVGLERDDGRRPALLSRSTRKRTDVPRAPCVTVPPRTTTFSSVDAGSRSRPATAKGASTTKERARGSPCHGEVSVGQHGTSGRGVPDLVEDRGHPCRHGRGVEALHGERGVVPQLEANSGRGRFAARRARGGSRRPSSSGAAGSGAPLQRVADEASRRPRGRGAWSRIPARRSRRNAAGHRRRCPAPPRRRRAAQAPRTSSRRCPRARAADGR